MDRPDIEDLIFQLYHNPQGQAQANRLLTLAQISPEAWTFSWNFLSAGKPVEVQYFGASSLHLKISKCWHELDENDADKIALRNKLMETLLNLMSDGDSRIVQTRLSVALASYVVHTVNDLWESAISDLISNLSPEKLSGRIPAPKVILTLIELLMMIPEEFNSLFLSLNTKNAIRFSLMKSIPQVFDVIQKILLESNPGPQMLELQQTAIKCYMNWCQHLGILVLDEVSEEILQLVLSKIEHDELVTYAVDAIVSIYTHPEIHKHPNSILRLIMKLNQVESVLERALQAKDIETCGTIYSLFIMVAETHSRLLLDTVYEKPEHQESIGRLISIVLKCSSTPGYYPIDETFSEQAFNFFYILQDDIIGSDPERAKFYLQMFGPLYQSLIETLLVKVQFPPDVVYNNDWSSEDKEAFRCYRQDIGDTFMYCFNMLRGTVMDTLKTNFDKALTHLVISSQQSSHNPLDKPWQPLEAVIFAYSSVAENISGPDESNLTPIFESLNNIPFNASDRLVSTTMEMLGSFCEWFYHHPHLLPRILSLILIGIKGHHMATVSATMALKDLTRECQILLEPYAMDILNVCSEGLSPESNLKPKERARLMCSVGQVLSLLPNQTIEQYLSTILPPIFNRLQQLMNETTEFNGEKQTNHHAVRNEIANQINIISMLFSNIDLEIKKEKPMTHPDEGIVVNQRNPMYQVFQQLLPFIANIGIKWINEEVVVEALAECIKKGVVCLLDEVKPLVEDLLQIVMKFYEASSQPSLTDVLKQLLILFYVDPLMKDQIVSSFSSFCSQTVIICQDMRNKTNVIEYFFSTITSILKKQPAVFVSHPIDVQSIFRLACAALLLPEKPTVKACSSFLGEFINRSRESDEMTRVVNSDGEALTTQVFLVMGGTVDSPRNVVEFMADILIALNQKYFDNLTRWLSSQIQRENFPTERVTIEQKENFVRLILRERKNKRKIKEFINEFSLVCRGLLNEYGIQPIKTLPF